ncbi:MAG: cation:proton antiporter [Phycisphaerales bacterium]|nr:cation:proton antiporter [Phycisphaerales bacterium]
MHGWEVITDLVVLLSVASVLGVIAERIGLSAIVGAILGGMLVGPGLLGWVQGDQLEVQYVAEFGVALLLFTIGLEITREKLVAFGLPGARAGLLQVVLTMAGASAVANLLGWEWPGSLAIGAMVALSSTAAVARSLFDSGQLESAHGRLALATLLVQDIAIVPLVVLLAVIGGPVQVGEVATELGFAGARFVVAVLIIGSVAILLIPRLLQSSHLSGNRELPVVLAVVTGVLAAWLSHELGLSAAVGAFIAGLALANSPFARQIRSDVAGLKAIFLTIFFASIGTLADLTWLAAPDRVLTVLLLACLIIVGKILATGLAARLAGAAAGTAIGVGFCVAQIGEFSFVLGGVARNEGLLAGETLDLFVAASVVTLLLVPMMVAVAPRVAAGLRSPVEGSTSKGGHGRVIVIGIGPSAQQALSCAREAGVPVTVIDFNSHEVLRRRQAGDEGIVGDARRPETLRAAGVARARLIVVSLPDPQAAAEVVRQVRTLAVSTPVVVRCGYNRAEAQLRVAGATEIVLEEDAVGLVLGRAVQDQLERAPV